MTATKKATKAKAATPVMTAAERQAKRRALLAQEGGRVLSVNLSAAGAKALDKLTKSGLSATDVINAALIATATKPKR